MPTEESAVTASMFSIRPFQAEDLPAMQSVRKAAFAPVFQSFRSIVGARVASLALQDADAEQALHLDQLCAQDPAKVWVAEVDDQVVGFCAFTLDADKRIGEIGLNAVHPNHAGQGIGTRMYDVVVAHMKQSGMALAAVSAGGDASHAPARRAYEKAGFGAGLPSVYLYKVL
jgi:RimJ/RimL family protein N-acetyltransferase